MLFSYRPTRPVQADTTATPPETPRDPELSPPRVRREAFAFPSTAPDSPFGRARSRPVPRLPPPRGARLGLPARPRPHLAVGAGVAAPMARVDLVPAETAQLDPAGERRVRGESVLAEEEGAALQRPPRSGWPRMGRRGAAKALTS